MSLVPLRTRTTRTTPAYRTGFDEFDRVFDSLFRNALTNMSAPSASVTDLAVKLDISETEKLYVIKAELPGVDEKDVEVTVDDGVLNISGQKHQEEEEEGKTFHRIERSYGSFRRSMALPADADENAVKAHMKNGLLVLEIGKIKEKKKEAKRIAIHSK